MTGDAMTLRDHIADVLKKHSIHTRPYTDPDEKAQDADALLADPTLAALFALAAGGAWPDDKDVDRKLRFLLDDYERWLSKR